MAFLTSDKIKVFPAGFRKNVTDNSKTTTEENLTGLTLLSADNSIRNRWIENPENSDEYLIYIKGYKFIIAKSDIPSDCEYASIKLRTIDNLKVLGNYNDLNNPSLDVTVRVEDKDISQFQGLEFSTTPPSTGDNYWVQKNTNLIITSKEIKNVGSAKVKSISQEFNTETLNVTTMNATDIDVANNAYIGGNLSVWGEVNNLTFESSANYPIGITNSSASVKAAKNTEIIFNKGINVEGDTNINVTTTIGSADTGPVTIKSDGAGNTSIVGPNYGKINLPSNNNTNIDKVWVQKNSQNYWVEHTSTASGSTIMSRDRNGDTEARNLTIEKVNNISINKAAAKESEPAKLAISAAGSTGVDFGLNIADPAQLKVTAGGTILVETNDTAGDTTYVGSGVHVSLNEAGNQITVGKNSADNVANPSVELPLAKTSSIGNISDANKIVVTDASGNISGAALGEVAKATNVTTNINGKAISTIFETDGITVKNATNATNAETAGKVSYTLSFITNGNGETSAYDGSTARAISYNSIGAASASHADSNGDNGKGTGTNYGHVKLGLIDQNGVIAADGIAAPNGHTHSQYLTGNQTITFTGDVTGSGETDIELTLKASGAAAGSYGDSNAQTPNYGETFKVPYITVDAKGRVTGISDHTVKIPASDNKDTLNTAGSNDYADKLYLIGAPGQAPSYETYSNNKVYTQNGNLYCTQLYLSSDARLKDNLTFYTPDKSVLDLPVYKYDFIEGPKNQIGCLAQDLQDICPEIVTEDEKGYLHIIESKLVYLLLDEVKKLKQEVEDLKRR